MKEKELNEKISVKDSEDSELNKLKAELAAEKAKNKFKPEMAEIPKEQLELPKGMHESDIKTSVRDMSAIIKEKMDQLHDLATMEVLMDTSVRVKNRLESIKKMGSANHNKIRGIWKTTPPKMHISKLEAKKINNDEFEISFGVFETDDKGNKKLYVNYADMTLHNGETIKRPTSAEYKIAYEVVEKIRTGKAITREVIRINNI